jgi:hypothetical protein
MNPMQILMNKLQMQMKARNPQLFQQFEQLKGNQSNPQDVLNNMMKDYSPEQIKQFQSFANGFGITNEQLSKYGIGKK